jgi:hypothetical protein
MEFLLSELSPGVHNSARCASVPHGQIQLRRRKIPLIDPRVTRAAATGIRGQDDRPHAGPRRPAPGSAAGSRAAARQHSVEVARQTGEPSRYSSAPPAVPRTVSALLSVAASRRLSGRGVAVQGVVPAVNPGNQRITQPGSATCRGHHPAPSPLRPHQRASPRSEPGKPPARPHPCVDRHTQVTRTVGERFRAAPPVQAGGRRGSVRSGAYREQPSRAACGRAVVEPEQRGPHAYSAARPGSECTDGSTARAR